MLNRSNPPSTPNRPRSNSHPIRPLRPRTPSEINERAPVRPLRSPARPPALGQGLLRPLPSIPSNTTTASPDDCWEGENGNEGYRPAVDAPLSKPLVKSMQKARKVPLPQINTLDRKILQELKHSMLARSAQFTLKNNARHHPFPSDQVPYPRSYDHKCLDTDVWETLFCEQYSGNITFHPFDVPPTKVLDLGCGSGSWIMACAMRWKSCHFVGLDVVPLHPDLGRSELGQRVTWVQTNFLEPLPFPNEEFDFVHIKRIARGVPVNKWDALFEEVIRVMKPGAVLEMVEEDLYIPGQVMESTGNDSTSPGSPSSGSPEELSQPYLPFAPRPSTSLPDISACYSGSQTMRRSISERRKIQLPPSQATSNTFPPPVPTRPIPSIPDYSRVFPRPRPSTSRPIASHFKFHNLLSKRFVREDGSETDGEQPRKPKKEPLISMSLFDKNRSQASGGRLPFSKPYLNKSGTSSNSTLRSNTTIHVPPVPPQGLPRFSEMDLRLALPLVDNPSDELEPDFLQDDESPRSLSEQLPSPPPEDDMRWKPPPNILSSLNSGFFDESDSEPTESNEWEEKLDLNPPVPPPKDIPGPSTSLRTSLSPSSSDVSTSATGLSLSGPDNRFADHSDHNDWLSPTHDSSGVGRDLSTTSLAISTTCTTGPALSQNCISTEDSGADKSPIISVNAETPPNPRQHNLLDTIYTEMHTARSVNLAPISLIENRIRTHFMNVRTRAPMIFAFPPPPGCQHRSEFDPAELQQRKPPDRQRGAERDGDQDRYLGPATHPTKLSPLISAFPPPPGRPEFDETPPSTPSSKISRPSSLKSTSPRSPRERSFSITSNEPGPSRARSSSVKSGHSTAETVNHRPSCLKGSRSAIRPGDAALPDRILATGEAHAIRKNEYAMMDTPAVGRFPPARVASDERERYRQRSDSLFTPPNDLGWGRGGGETGGKLPAPALKPTRPLTAGSFLPPSSFIYKTPNAAFSSPSIASPSSPTTTRRGSGKGKLSLSVADKAQLDPMPNTKAEIHTRTLSLHLRARVVEILGCSEAMWDWLREFQIQEREKERKLREKLARSPKQGVGGGRVAYYHHDRRNRGARERTDGGQLAVSSKTSREPVSPASKTSGEQPAPPAKPVRRRAGGGRVSYFHQPVVKNPAGRERANSGSTDNSTLRRPAKSYTSDSRSNGAPSLYSATSSGSSKTEAPHDHMEKSIKQELVRMTRQRFDEILLWFQFDMDDSIRLTNLMTTRTDSSSFPTEPGEQRKAFDEACQKLETHLQLRPKLLTPLESSVSGSSSGSAQSGQHCEEGLCCMPALLGLVHPSKRLCRTIRVWVAWKP